MDCKEFQDTLYDKSATGTDGEIKEHISQCRECADRYATLQALQPKASPKLRNRSSAMLWLKRMKKEKPMRGTGRTRYAAAAAIVAATLTLTAILAKPDRAAAASLLDRSIANTEGLESMFVMLDVRTFPEENFSYIGLDEEMAPHALTVIMGDPYMWRLEKGGRVILCDGHAKYIRFPPCNYGYAGSPNPNFEEWFWMLVKPATIPCKERGRIPQ